MVLVDVRSKWIEAHPMSAITATSTIELLRSIFAQFGIPESLVSDNGPQFTSEEFRQFCRRNGIHQVLVALYHPSSNGLAERAVQTLKQSLRKVSEGTLKGRLSRVLFNYRITPQSTTSRSPAELLFGRQLRSRLDLLKESGKSTGTPEVRSQWACSKPYLSWGRGGVLQELWSIWSPLAFWSYHSIHWTCLRSSGVGRWLPSTASPRPDPEEKATTHGTWDVGPWGTTTRRTDQPTGDWDSWRAVEFARYRGTNRATQLGECGTISTDISQSHRCRNSYDAYPYGANTHSSEICRYQHHHIVTLPGFESPQKDLDFKEGGMWQLTLRNGMFITE